MKRATARLLTAALSGLILIIPAYRTNAQGICNPKLDCFSIVVGKGASADGSVIVAHNEDTGTRLVNYYKVPAMDYPPGEEIRFENGGKTAQVSHTLGHWAHEVFMLEGRDAFILLPEKISGTIPWVWYAPTLPRLPGTEENWMFERFLKAGIAVAGIDAGESYGSPDGNKLYSALYRELTENRGFSAKPVMLGRSRGGLMTLSWMAENPDKTGGFAGIYPVCDLTSYPGLEKACSAFGLTPEQLKVRLAEFNPVAKLAPLAAEGVPLFAIHGDRDELVPLERNSGEMKLRYDALGGKMKLIVPKGQGHNMWEGFFQSKELVRFVIKNAN